MYVHRRQQKCDGEVQNASFFDRHNAHGMEMRERALMAALDDLTAYLNSDQGQVGHNYHMAFALLHASMQYVRTMCSAHASLLHASRQCTVHWLTTY